MKLFCIFASAILAGCATLCVLSCSEDEFDDFEDDEVYTLSRPKKTNTFEYAEGKGGDAYGDIANGELLWHKDASTTFTFNTWYREYYGNDYEVIYETYVFPFDLKGEVVYTIDDSVSNPVTHYGALLEWTPAYSNIQIKITNASSTSIHYRVRFANPRYNPAQSQNPPQYYYDYGSITY